MATGLNKNQPQNLPWLVEASIGVSQ